MSIERGISSNAMLSSSRNSPRTNKSISKIKQFQGTLIQFMPLITTVKCQKKSVTNDYSKFYMLQVISFMTNEPAKNKKQLLWRHEKQQGLGVRPGAPWVAIPVVLHITCASSRLLNKPSFGFLIFFFLGGGGTYFRSCLFRLTCKVLGSY